MKKWRGIVLYLSCGMRERKAIMAEPAESLPTETATTVLLNDFASLKATTMIASCGLIAA